MKFCNFFEAANSKVLVVVDVQPEYQKSFTFDIEEFTRYLNSTRYGRKVILFNGPDLGFPTREELHVWYLENGLRESVKLEFYDKGYAFFRYCMDSDIENQDIVNLVKFMKQNNVNDSRQIAESNLWDSFVEKYNNQQLRDLLEFSGDCINLPDVMDYLQQFGNNIVLTGGGRDECLREVEIALLANDQKYLTEPKFIY